MTAQPRGAVLPDAIRRLPFADKLQRLANLDPERARQVERDINWIVDYVLEQAWQENSR